MEGCGRERTCDGLLDPDMLGTCQHMLGVLYILSNPISQYSCETGIKTSLLLLPWSTDQDDSFFPFFLRKRKIQNGYTFLSPPWAAPSLCWGNASSPGQAVSPLKGEGHCHPLSVLPTTSCVAQKWSDPYNWLRKMPRLGLWGSRTTLSHLLAQASMLHSPCVFGEGVRSRGLTSFLNQIRRSNLY